MYFPKIFITENRRKFSVCSKNSMIAKLEELPVDNDDCFRDVAYDESFSDLQISLCGNGEVEIGEDCDCGMNINQFRIFLGVLVSRWHEVYSFCGI